jgi:Ca-activated chloride channel family protein
MEIIFRNPFYLWALVVVPIIIIAHFLSLQYSKGRAIKFANFAALARVSQRVQVTSNIPVLMLRITVFIAIVFSISGTSLRYNGSQIDADYILAVDASASMTAEDLFPNRFDAAKDSALSFVDTLPIYSQVGVISFSGTSYVHQPLTIDKKLVKNAINEQRILVSGGTSVGDAIITGTNLLMNSAKPRVIILITDGRSNVGISVSNAIAYANNNNIIVYTLGIGTEEGYFLNLSDAAGSLGVNTLELEIIASSTGGKFYYPKTRQELLLAYSDVATSEKTKASFDLTFFLLIYILVALITEWVLVNTRYKVIP